MKLERGLWLFVIAVLLFWLRSGKEGTTVEGSPVITVQHDTIWRTKIDTFLLERTKFKKVYVYREQPAVVVSDSTLIKDTTAVMTARAYRDTLQTPSLEIYSYQLIRGVLLDGKLTYKNKTAEVNVKKTIRYPKQYYSGWYIFSELGGNATKFSNVSLGVQYQHRGAWFASYRMNLSTWSQPTHNIGVGYRLFR